MKRTKKSAANSTQAAIKPKRGPTPASWKPGQSGNPKGAPKRGESWREVVRSMGNLTVPEALARWPELADALPPHGDLSTVTIKEIVVMRAFKAILTAPDSALWNAIMDRAEGRPAQPIENSWKAEVADWLKQEKVTLDQIKAELSDDLYAEFLEYIGPGHAGAR